MCSVLVISSREAGRHKENQEENEKEKFLISKFKNVDVLQQLSAEGDSRGSWQALELHQKINVCVPSVRVG